VRRDKHATDQKSLSHTCDTILYVRVSSKEQEREGFSIPAQIKLLRDYAAEQGFKIVKEFVDIETAKQS